MGYNDAKIAKLVSKGTGKSPGFDHFLARTDSQREEIFRLRYEAYSDFGHVAEMCNPSLSDEYDAQRGSYNYGVTLNGQLVSTIRLGIISRENKASITYEVFQDCLDPIVDQGERIAHGSRLAVWCGNSAIRRGVVMYTLGLTATFATKYGADRGAIIVREGHVPFYQRYGFDLVSGPRLYHESKTPLSLMMMKLDKPGSSNRSGGPGVKELSRLSRT